MCYAAPPTSMAAPFTTYAAAPTMQAAPMTYAAAPATYAAAPVTTYGAAPTLGRHSPRFTVLLDWTGTLASAAINLTTSQSPRMLPSLPPRSRQFAFCAAGAGKGVDGVKK